MLRLAPMLQRLWHRVFRARDGDAMSWLKQVLIILCLAVIALGIWIRFDPGAGDLMTRWGVSPGLVGLIASQKEPEGNSGAGTERPPAAEGTPVVTSRAGRAAINDRVSAIGDGEALHSVTVYPRAQGILTEIRVAPGDRVETGQVLAVLDLETQTIARDQARLAVRVAEEKVGRYERLVQSRAVSEIQLVEARNELESARLVLRGAEVALEERLIKAPIGGIVGILPVQRGDFVQDQTEIATIDDRSMIIVDFWVPERFAPLVKPGQTIDAEPVAIGGLTYPGVVAAIASRVDRVSRTLQIRAHVENRDDQLRPGMSFKVNLYFQGRHYAAVDPLAIQWSASGPYVWKNSAEKSEKVPVTIIQRNADYVLVSGEISAGDEVIIEGLQSLRPGAAIRITRRSGAPTASEGS
jgi:RND family efflux transporter MFP subunit